MKIVCDENIPSAQEAFGSLGELRLVPAARIAAELRDAEILIVRSVTRVDEALLADSRVRFVGSVTAGLDHVDAGYLARRGIALASAPGCNSTAVSQHIAAFLCAMHELWEARPRPTIGIIGVGHCGGKVETVARALGFETILCDPPLHRQTGSSRFRPLAELVDCDVITLHTPLIREGPDRTLAMIDRNFIERMKPRGIILNTARGGLVVESALLEALKSGRLSGAALDVWQGEPEIDLAVLDAVTLGTPHVAGYSYEGRTRGTEMVHGELCRFLGKESHWSATAAIAASRQTIRLSRGSSVADAVQAAHPVRRTDTALRRLTTLPRDEHRAYFENLRKASMRHEFAAFSIELTSPSPALAASLTALGFSVGPAGGGAG